MILSASRRTDIPAFFGKWFINRIREGYVYTRNPMNHRQVSRIELNSETTDLIVFWTKNPKPFMKYLDEIPYPFYFQVSLTPYGKGIESGLPNKEDLIEAYIELSKKIGKERMVWRYDPVLLTEEHTTSSHKKYFNDFAKRLAPYSSKCVLGFFDLYKKNEKTIRENNIRSPFGSELDDLVSFFSRVASEYGLLIESCRETLDFSGYGIEHGQCIDKRMIESILGEVVNLSKDSGQVKSCGCMKSIDVGFYNTCLNGCIYCYANYSKSAIENLLKKHNPQSPLLIGDIESEDQVYDRNLKSCRNGQIILKL